jgi:pantoate--beta-alanine ligase
MNTVKTVRELRAAVAHARKAGKRIGFVPTMGNLHSGHASLVSKAVQQADFVVASIFVNPLQFGAGEDLDKYPRTLAADQEKLLQAGCNRPGHFEGVATVVSKLFNMVQPDIAVFGQKDYQQLAVIRAMVHDLNMPIQIIGEPTVRADDGLALSSRNGFLSEEERAIAPVLYRSLNQIAAAIKSGDHDFARLRAEQVQQIEAAGLRLDYLEVRQGVHLRTATAEDRDIVILVAAFLGTTRLIDNLHLNLN